MTFGVTLIGLVPTDFQKIKLEKKDYSSSLYWRFYIFALNKHSCSNNLFNKLNKNI